MLKRILIFLLALCCCGSALADTYQGYNYDAWGDSVPAPQSYLPIRSITLNDTGKALKNPSDVFVWQEKLVYISDSGNNRIVVLDDQFSLVKEISAYESGEGSIPLTNPAGIFVDGAGLLYVCLPDEGRVVVLDGNNTLVREYGRPESDLLEDTTVYKPNKVIANQLGTVFVLPQGMYLGAVMYDSQGKFLGFYGANDVVVTVDVMMDYLWKQILTQEQVSSMARYVPVQYASFDIDENNFIYTCTNESNNTYSEISKLNSMGDNVLIAYTRNVTSQTNDFGDLERATYLGQMQDSRFVDLAIHDNEILYALDRTRGRVFVYDQESHLLSVFGGSGDQLGTFDYPIAIDTIGQTVMVLDHEKSCLTLFERTHYGELVESAVLLYMDGLYADARELWEQVALYNVNCELAYTGIGKALYEEGRYKEAMHYFKLGYDREGYSRAFDEYRMEVARGVFPVVCTALVIGGAALMIFAKLRRSRAIKTGRRDA